MVPETGVTSNWGRGPGFLGGTSPGTLRPAVLIQGVLGAFCGRLAAARAAFIDLEPSSAPCGSLGSILLGTLAPAGELLRVLWESREPKCMLFLRKYDGFCIFHDLAFVIASGDLHGLGGAPMLPCGPWGSPGRLLGGAWRPLDARLGCPLGLLGNLLAVPWTLWSSLG